MPVDMGFIVYNDWTYPHFLSLLEELGVDTQPSDMSFSVACETSGLEYECSGASGFFAQRRNAFSPRHWRLLRDVRFFQQAAHRFLERPDPKVSLGAWLAGLPLGEDFGPRHLVPMGAAIWSARSDRLLEFPAATFLRFFRNHGLLSLHEDPQWRVIRGGSRSYVDRLVSRLDAEVHASTPVRSVRRHDDSVDLVLADGSLRSFDRVVLACHSDQALALLEAPRPAEQRVLGAIGYQENEAVLHTDARWLPSERRAWASWNVRVPRGGDGAAVVTYHMNRLQSLAPGLELCVTLNPHRPIDDAHVIERWVTQHPIFDAAAIDAQGRRSAVSGSDRIHYCGAYWGYGFHEDGVRSAREVARELGVTP